MDFSIIEGLEITPLKQIRLPKGDVFHGLKKSDLSFKGFGELYFSFIQFGEIKAWKKHDRMICNFIVPQGKIRFVIYDSRTESSSFGHFSEIVLSPENYYRLTVPANLWYGFRGESEVANMIVNIANIEHDPHEQINVDINDPIVPYKW